MAQWSGLSVACS